MTRTMHPRKMITHKKGNAMKFADPTGLRVKEVIRKPGFAAVSNLRILLLPRRKNEHGCSEASPEVGS
jgi:hypothetical protein